MSSFEQVVTIHWLAALDLGTSVEQPFDCLIIQNRQAVQLMWMSMDWTWKVNMVDGLFCATFKGCRRGCTPFVQAGAETADTGVEVLSQTHECCPATLSVVIFRWSAQSAAFVSLSEELMSCATSTDGCLDLRRRAFALGGQVSAECSRCPGSMTRVLETVWLLCDEAQQVGYLRR